MRYRYIFAVILVLLILLTGCSQQAKSKKTKSDEKVEKSKTESYAVYLNEQRVEDITPVTSVRLYFLQTVKSMGMTVEKIDSGFFHICYNDTIYILSCYPEVRLTEQGKEYDNLMVPFPGNTEFCCGYDGEDVLVDIELLRSTLFSMGYDIQVEIDEENSIVKITQATQKDSSIVS